MCRYPPAESIFPARHVNKPISHLSDQPIQQLNTNKASLFGHYTERKNHPAKPYPNSHKIISECGFCFKPASFEITCSAAISHGNAGQAGLRDSTAIFAIKVKSSSPGKRLCKGLILSLGIPLLLHSVSLVLSK